MPYFPRVRGWVRCLPRAEAGCLARPESMRILSPIDGNDRVRDLVASPAHEFYCGLLPPEHVARFTPMYSLNRRSFVSCSFPDMETLRAAAAQVLAAGKKLFVAFNAPFYQEREYRTVLDAARVVEADGLSGLILSDPGLMAFLRASGITLPFAAGVDTGLLNGAGIRFLDAAVGLRRVILDRCFSLREVTDIVASAPGLEYEVIVSNSYCKNVDGFCRHVHGLNAAGNVDDFANRMIPCWYPHTVEVMEAGDPERGESLARFLEAASRVPYGGCAACALPELQAAGVGFAKLAVRGFPTERKLADIRFFAECIELAARGLHPEEYRAEARALHERFLQAGCRATECYYG